MISKTTVVKGKRIRWIEQGEGWAVVLIHGIPTSPKLWRHVIPRVSGVRCLAFEMMGYGESMQEGADPDITVAHQADHLVAWLANLGIDRAILVGHDLGGGVAQIAAVRHPQRCAGLLLTNAIGYDSWPIPSVKTLKAMAPLVKHLPNSAAKQIMRTLMYQGHDDPALARESLELHWKPYARHQGAASLIRQVKALDVNDTLAVADGLASLEVPARIVWGAADKFQKIEYGERFASDLHAPLHRIEQGLHFTPEEYPDILAGQIGLLIDDIRQKAANQETGTKAR